MYGIGASSGGAFAAELASRGVASGGALAMVMSLSDGVVRRLISSRVPMYLAPMPRDVGTTGKVRMNYEALTRKDPENDSDGGVGTKGARRRAILNDTACVPLPVTESYLVQRVPGMTREVAAELTSTLRRIGHADRATGMLVVDPTTSDWRARLSPDNATHWGGSSRCVRGTRRSFVRSRWGEDV